jgi:hypothetical protein
MGIRVSADYALPVALAVLSIAYPAAGQNKVVTLTPGEDIQRLVDLSSPDTTFVFQPGTYWLQSIRPKDGDTFAGQPGAVLSGAVLLTAFAQAGGFWVAQDPYGPGQVNGYCDAGHPRCMYAEDLFFDNKPLLHAPSLAAVTTGSYFFDYANHLVYLADDPGGHTVEVAAARSAFWGPARNVTIMGLVVEKYAVPGQFGAIGDQYPGVDWVILNNEVRWNHAGGVSLGHGGVAIRNYIHDNGQKGIGGANGNLLAQNNEVARNGYAGFDIGWEAGGMKFGAANGLAIRGNYVHDNIGPGVWCDVDSVDTLIDGNTVISNVGGPGIQYEISYAATIRNNNVRYNYVPNSGWWMWGAQILLQNSANSEVYGNTVVVGGDGNAIGIVNQNRGAGPWGPREALNNYVHHNTVVAEKSPSGRSGLVADWNAQSILANGNNRFDYNTYHVSDVNQWQWAWGWGMQWPGFLAAGQEAHGTVDDQIPAPSTAPPSEFSPSSGL